MTPSPIRKVLSSFHRHRVRALLMGGQACILHGAAEFSRDTDFVILCESSNLRRLRAALHELRAEPVFVPPLEEPYLLRGHACHFRCQAKGVERLRVDVMATMRGCDPFPLLWRRRKGVRLAGVGVINLLALPDLVIAKKTQRDKDWPMIRRLLEADYYTKSARATAADARFWLRELRTPDLLIAVAKRFPRLTYGVEKLRPLLRHAREGNASRVQRALDAEAARERRADRAYWLPLRRELARLRR